MKQSIRNAEGLTWLLRHTRAFRGGRLVECHVMRRLLFDDRLDREVPAGTTVTLTVRYEYLECEPSAGEASSARTLPRVHRVAQLRCEGVSDFSLFEQEGADGGRIDALQVECYDERIRLWFDQYGEVYVVCDVVEFDEVALPMARTAGTPPREWAFQSRTGALPSVDWLLRQLDSRRLPCSWRADQKQDVRAQGYVWSGVLTRRAGREGPAQQGVVLQGSVAIDGAAFGVVVRVPGDGAADDALVAAVMDVMTEQFEGDYLGVQGRLPS